MHIIFGVIEIVFLFMKFLDYSENRV